MALTPGDIANRVGQEVVGFFGAVPGPLAQEAAEDIRDYQPGVSFPQLGIEVARKICRVYGSNPDGVSGVAAAGLERVCRPYLDDIDFGSGPRLELPFRGGQCAQTYILRVQQVEPDGSTPFEPDQIRTRGPIAGIRYEENFNGIPGLVGWFIGSHSSPQVNGVCADLADEGFAYRLQGTFTRPADRVLVGLIPCGDDSCGNREPDYEEPIPPTEPEPPSSPIVIAPNIDIDLEVNINLDGTIEFNLGVGPVIINPFGRGGDDGGGGPDPEPSPPAPEPGPTLPGGNGGFGGDDSFGEPPAGRRWVGCCITITQKPDNSGIITTSEPEDVYPSVVGNIRLVFNAAGSRQTDTPVRINAKKVCVWEPVAKLNPVGVNVDLLPGFGYVYTPYSVPLED